jgi:hypothetical protein
MIQIIFKSTSTLVFKDVIFICRNLLDKDADVDIGQEDIQRIR